MNAIIYDFDWKNGKEKGWKSIINPLNVCCAKMSEKEMAIRIYSSTMTEFQKTRPVGDRNIARDAYRYICNCIESTGAPMPESNPMPIEFVEKSMKIVVNPANVFCAILNRELDDKKQMVYTEILYDVNLNVIYTREFGTDENLAESSFRYIKNCVESTKP